MAHKIFGLTPLHVLHLFIPKLQDKCSFKWLVSNLRITRIGWNIKQCKHWTGWESLFDVVPIDNGVFDICR